MPCLETSFGFKFATSSTQPSKKIAVFSSDEQLVDSIDSVIVISEWKTCQKVYA